MTDARVITVGSPMLFRQQVARALQWKAAQQHVKSLNGDYDSRVFTAKKDWDAFVKEVDKQAKAK